MLYWLFFILSICFLSFFPEIQISLGRSGSAAFVAGIGGRDEVALVHAAAAAAEPRVPTALAIQEAGRQYAGDLSAQADRRRIVRFRFRVS